MHLTTAGEAIEKSVTIIGRNGIYATSLDTAGHTGFGLTLRTGLTDATSAFRIPESAMGAFSKPVPIGPFTAWQRAFGTQYTAAGTLDLATGTFTRTGVNWNQVFLYGVDATATGAALGGAYYGLKE